MKKITGNEFDEKFDNGDSDITEYLDMDLVQSPNKRQKVNVDFPVWMVESLDNEAARIGVTRQAIIKMWISDRLSR
jgi:YbbR domain-containing protein